MANKWHHSICCNTCYRRLTKKEASVYTYHWQHSGDMYCAKCRSCPDDCRREQCLMTSKKGEVNR